eukprot:scaffold55661_cov69-Phaeocystis_antarctica.AAC.3
MEGSSSSRPSVEPQNGTRVSTPGALLARPVVGSTSSRMLSAQQLVADSRLAVLSHSRYQSLVFEQYQCGALGLFSLASRMLLPSPGTMTTGDSGTAEMDTAANMPAPLSRPCHDARDDAGGHAKFADAL